MDTDPPIEVSASDRQVKRRREWKRILSIPIIVAFVLGILSVAVFNAVLESTNAEEFCISCHDAVYQEYRDSAHNINRTGVRAVCVDCHLPKEFFPKILHKIKASNDLWHSILGSIDTPEKFEGKRGVLAQREWDRLKTNNSRECLHCHTPESFDLGAQGRRAVAQHEQELMTKKQTCIDCHKGVVHRMPKGIDLGQTDSTDPKVDNAND